jgi:hypothetical protein
MSGFLLHSSICSVCLRKHRAAIIAKEREITRLKNDLRVVLAELLKRAPEPPAASLEFDFAEEKEETV